MLGIFQTDLPIGRRLWLFFIVAVLLGQATSLVASASNSPSKFVMDILLLFGAAVAISIPGLVLVAFMEAIASVSWRWRKAFKKPYDAAVVSYKENSRFELLDGLVFAIASALVLLYSGIPAMKFIGMIGLTVILLGEMIRDYDWQESIVEMLVLHQASDSALLVTLFGGDGYKETFETENGILEQLAFLLRNGWKLGESQPGKPDGSVILVRELKISHWQYSRRCKSRRHIRTTVESDEVRG